MTPLEITLIVCIVILLLFIQTLMQIKGEQKKRMEHLSDIIQRYAERHHSSRDSASFMPKPGSPGLTIHPSNTNLQGMKPYNASYDEEAKTLFVVNKEGEVVPINESNLVEKVYIESNNQI